MKDRTFFSVLCFLTGEYVFRGTCEYRTAMALNPGCCYGKGKTQHAADVEAALWAKHFTKGASDGND